MTYIENIFICLAIPMLLSLFFTGGRARRFTLFVILGMGVCLLSAYISSFFMQYYRTDAVTTAIEIAPVCEELMKLLPLLFYFLVLEPEPRQLPAALAGAGRYGWHAGGLHLPARHLQSAHHRRRRLAAGGLSAALRADRSSVCRPAAAGCPQAAAGIGVGRRPLQHCRAPPTIPHRRAAMRLPLLVRAAQAVPMREAFRFEQIGTAYAAPADFCRNPFEPSQAGRLNFFAFFRQRGESFFFLPPFNR